MYMYMYSETCNEKNKTVYLRSSKLKYCRAESASWLRMISRDFMHGIRNSLRTILSSGFVFSTAVNLGKLCFDILEERKAKPISLLD